MLANLGLWSSPPVQAESMVPSGDFEDEALAQQWARPGFVSQTQEESVTGDSSLRFHRMTWATAPELVQIDPQQSFVLRVFSKEPTVKLASEYHPIDLYIGLRLFDENQKSIGAYDVAPIPDTETVLAQKVSEGDTTLHLKGAPWKGTYAVPTAVAFDAKEDLSDLPNHQTVEIKDISAGNGKGEFEVSLGSPLEMSFPIGTRVRRHRYADFPVFTAKPGPDWEEHIFSVGGVSEPGVIEKGKFWYGTCYVRPSIGVLFPRDESVNSETPLDLLIDDVTFSQE